MGEVSLQGGSWNNARLSADLGGPVNDRVAARVTGMYEDSESYRDGVNLERHGINPTAAVQLSDNTQLRLGYEYYDYDRIADRGIPSLSGRPYEVDASTFFGDPDRSPTDATVNIATVVLDHEFSETVSLRNRTLYGDYNKFYQNVFPGAIDATAGTVAISAYNNEQLRENIFNQTDLLFSLNSDR